MELKKIKYASAVYFGVFALVMFLIQGIFSFIIVKQAPELASVLGEASALQLIVYAPLIGGIVVYIFTLLAICVYNWVAQKYPITWEVKK